MSTYQPDVYTGDGSTTTFAISFEYLSESDVKVYVDGEETEFSFASANVASIEPAPALGAIIKIDRDTNDDELAVIFPNGPTLRSRQLNRAIKQLYYLTQEAKNEVQEGLTLDNADRYDADGHRITNVANPVDDSDVVNKAYADEVITEAETSASAAASSASAAANSASSALASKMAAASSETNAASSESAAATSASEASDARDETIAARDTTAGYRLVAQNARDDAQDARDETIAAKDTAVSSASAAATSESNAATSEANAAQSEANAAASEAAAETARDEAEAFAATLRIEVSETEPADPTDGMIWLVPE